MATAVIERSPPKLFEVWIADDRSDERKVMSDCFSAIGATPVPAPSISRLGNAVRALEDGREPPEIIVLDQHWDVKNTDLSILGRADIPVSSQSTVGAALGRYVRDVPELDNTLILMTSVNEEEVSSPPVGLGPAVALLKKELKRLPELARTEGSPEAALEAIGVQADAMKVMRRTRKMLTYAASVFGLDEMGAAGLAGARSGTVATHGHFRDYLWSSRDAHERARYLMDIITLLIEAYGSQLPPLSRMSSEFSLPFEPALLEGSVQDLLWLRRNLETKAGGPID